MSPDYYLQSKGPANYSCHSVHIDGLLLGTFFITLLLPVALHFSNIIFISIRIILLTVFQRATATLKLFSRLCEIFSEIRQLQPVQQEHIAKLDNLRKQQKDQIAPPLEDFLHQATQQIQLASTTEELKHLEYCQATINEQQLILQHSPTVHLTPVSNIPVTKSDCALLEFINGEDRYMKFINQDLTFLLPSKINQPFKFNDQITNSDKKDIDKRKLV